MSKQLKGEDYINTDHIQTNIKTYSIRGGANVLSAEIVIFVLRISSTMVLARLLAPEDYGLVAMVSSVIGFAVIFKDLGLSTATIQKKNITTEQVNSLFWINVMLGGIIALIVVAISPLLADFYNDSRILGVTLFLSLPFVFSGLSVQHQALLKRQMLFKKLAVVRIVSFALGTAAGILTAILGAGYWALAWISVVQSVSMMLGMWISCRWRPSKPFFVPGTKPLIGFGTNIAGFNIVNYFARKMDNILIGKCLGAVSLGFYSKAYNLLLLPINQIRAPIVSVALPALCSLQEQSCSFKMYYRRILFIISFLSMPVIALIYVCADMIVLFMLGDKWLEIVPIFKVLSLAAFIQPASGTRGLVMISLGMTRKYLLFGIANSLLIVGSFIIGLQWGVIGVAIAYTVANYTILLPSLLYSFNRTPLGILDFFKPIFLPLITSSLMGGILIFIRPAFCNMNPLLSLFGLIPLGIVVYIGLWFILPKGRIHLADVWEYSRIIFRRKC